MVDLKADPDSTFLRPKTNTVESIKQWVSINLGGGLQTVELTDEQFNVAIQNALEKYTKYATFETEELIVDLNDYVPGKGLDLSKYNISVIKDISFRRDSLLGGFYPGCADTLWSYGGMMTGYAAQGMMPFFNHGMNSNANWVSLHGLHENIELINRMTGSMPQYRYRQSDKMLVITPEPHPGKGKQNKILITCEIEPPIDELLGNEYVKRLILAYSKIILGNVRKKFQNVQLLGGGQIDTSIGDEGREELEKLIEEIRQDESFGNLFVVA